MKIKIGNPAALNLAPTWAGIMPALIAAIEYGTGDGRKIATAELVRLAAEVDSANAETKNDARELAERFAGFARQNVADADNGNDAGRRAVAMARASAFYIAARDAQPWADSDYTGKASACYESAHVLRAEAGESVLIAARAMADAATLHVDSANGTPADMARAYGAAAALYRHAARHGGRRFAHCETLATETQRRARGQVEKAAAELAAMAAARDGAAYDLELFARDVARLAAFGFTFATRARFDESHAAALRDGIAGTAGAFAVYDSADCRDAESFAIVGDSPAELARDAAESVLS